MAVTDGECLVKLENTRGRDGSDPGYGRGAAFVGTSAAIVALVASGAALHLLRDCAHSSITAAAVSQPAGTNMVRAIPLRKP